VTKTRYTEGDGTIERARKLRRESTPAEDKLWSVLRGRGIDGAKFRRQQRFGRFVADFVCHAARLIVEVDGDTHAGDDARRRDARRSAFLEQEGYRVFRVSNTDVMENLEGVADAILAALRPSPSHPALPDGPLPLPQGERK